MRPAREIEYLPYLLLTSVVSRQQVAVHRFLPGQRRPFGEQQSRFHFACPTRLNDEKCGEKADDVKTVPTSSATSQNGHRIAYVGEVEW